MGQTTLLLWTGLSFVVVVVVAFVRYKRRKCLDLPEVVSLGVSTLGAVSSCQLLYKAFTLQALQDLLGQDIATLIIGAIAIIWVFVKEVWKALI